jgi:hypothetical protein
MQGFYEAEVIILYTKNSNGCDLRPVQATIRLPWDWIVGRLKMSRYGCSKVTAPCQLMALGLLCGTHALKICSITEFFDSSRKQFCTYGTICSGSLGSISTEFLQFPSLKENVHTPSLYNIITIRLTLLYYKVVMECNGFRYDAPGKKTFGKAWSADRLASKHQQVIKLWSSDPGDLAVPSPFLPCSRGLDHTL